MVMRNKNSEVGVELKLNTRRGRPKKKDEQIWQRKIRLITFNLDFAFE